MLGPYDTAHGGNMSCMKSFASMLALLILLAGTDRVMASNELLKRGQYIFFAAGCISCHTVDQPLAGGRAIDSPFGTFFSPNITPNRKYGIGTWSQEDLVRAMREGISPEGEYYYPAFPYPSFTRMTRQDIMALYAYLMAQPEFPTKNRPHELVWFLSNRSLIAHWRQNHFSPGVLQPDATKSREWNRGQYLAMALGHCGECHTPRGVLGDPLMDQYLAGTRSGPYGKRVPNITPDKETGIGNWTHTDIKTFLSTGRKPDGCYSSELMMEVLGTSCMRLTESDQHALAIYLSSLPPIHNDMDAIRNPKQENPELYE
jgi:mono/diheme cytochrome c family protein